MGTRAPAPMLPALPPPPAVIAAGHAPRARSPLAAAIGPRVLVLRLLVLPLLLLVLTVQGCSSASQPPRAVLLEALSLQIRLTQARVADALQLEPAGLPVVSRVRVEQQQAIAIGESRGLRLSGRFDWRLAEDPIRVDSPFELYLQRGEKGRSWRLARPVGSEPAKRADARLQDWITDPIPLPGEQPAALPLPLPVTGAAAEPTATATSG